MTPTMVDSDLKDKATWRKWQLQAKGVSKRRYNGMLFAADSSQHALLVHVWVYLCVFVQLTAKIGPKQSGQGAL